MKKLISKPGPGPTAGKRIPRGHRVGQPLLKGKRDEGSIKKGLWIGILAIGGIFVGLEWMRPVPREVGTSVKPAPAAVVAAAKPAATAPVAAELPSQEQLTAKEDDKAPKSVPEPGVSPGEPSEIPESERMANEPVIILTGMESTREPAQKRAAELFDRAANGHAWDAYRGLLGRSLQTGLAALPQGNGLNRYDAVWKEPLVYHALLRWKVLGAFTEAEICEHVSDSYTAGMLRWLVSEPKVMEEFLMTIHPNDDGAKVLKFLMDAWQIDEKKFAKYFSLALACAVVFDHPIGIPHQVGKKRYGVEAQVDPMQRYQWYITKSEKGELEVPVHHSSARDLIWVVCAPVTTSELEWSLDKMRLKRASWGDAYGMVSYLMERAVEGLNPYKEYSFEEILKEGGVCGDQAYFCVNTARAQGIAAMVIAGETDLGGHAWAGVKVDDDQWSTGVGRIGGASKGTTGNPQTGESLTEQEIQLWNDRLHNNKSTTIDVFRLLWLSHYFSASQRSEDRSTTVHLANRIGHSFVETWQALYDLLVTQTQIVGEPPAPTNLDEWKDFARNMRREYKENPRIATLAANAEMDYIFPYGTQGDVNRSLLRERRRLGRDASEQTDLIAQSLRRQADVLVKRGGPDVKRDIGRLYDRALRDYGGSVTGFKMMANDYFSYFKDDTEQARKAARDIELAYKRVLETGTTDWFRAQTEAGVCEMICGFYRNAGEPERAEMLKKRYKVMMRRSKRDAL